MYPKLSAVLKTQDGTTALFAVAETFSFSAKFLETPFFSLIKLALLKYWGLVFFFSSLAQFFLMLTSVVVNTPLSHCRLYFHKTPYLQYPKLTEMWECCPDGLQWN